MGTPRPPGRGTGWIWALLIVAAVAAVSLVILAVFANQFRLSNQLGMTAPRREDALREVLVEWASTRDKIAVVDVVGMITSDSWDYLGNSLVTYIEEQLSRAAEDENVKAVILKIDSPGGEVLASDEIYKLLMEFQDEHDKPVVASMGTVAASGGYYVAAPCRWIVANELTITGSIGVIMHGYNWRGLMDKVGIRPQVFKSGKLKDMLSPDKREEDITAEERRIVQDLVDETFQRFKSVVEEGRGFAKAHNEDNPGEEPDTGRALAENWEQFADGRLLSGKEAWNLGMVDELGNFTTAVERAQKLAGIDEARLVQYLRPMGLSSLFRLLGRSEQATIKLDLGLRLPELRAGLYYLTPQLMR
jgi:protease-4